MDVFDYLNVLQTILGVHYLFCVRVKLEFLEYIFQSIREVN
jgi:hypothetical protein